MHQYGKPAPGAKTLEYSGFAGPMFGNVLTGIKLLNQFGIANATVPPLDAKTPRVQGPGDAPGRRGEVQRSALRLGLRR